jgi:uncharacterized protein (DUF2141 family)
MVDHRNFALVLFLGATVSTARFGFARADEPAQAPAAAPLPAAAPTTASVAPAVSATLITLEVQAVGFDNDRGHAVAKLYRPGDNVLDKNAPFRISSEIHNGEARLRFPPLAEGTYALVVFHDENDKGEIEHNLLHLPSSQLGFSNGFRPGLFAGLPSFEKLQFRLERPLTTEIVAMTIVVK